VKIHRSAFLTTFEPSNFPTFEHLGESEDSMDTVWQDVKYGARMLVKNRGVTLIALLTLALGIGASTAIFSIVNAVILRPLPYPQSEQLVIALRKSPTWPVPTLASYPAFTDWQTSGAFAGVCAIGGRGLILQTPDGPQILGASRLSRGCFETLRVAPAIGGGFPQEAEHDPLYAVLSYTLWEKHCKRDPAIVGKTIELSKQPYRVVGVMPAGFRDPIDPSDLYVPLIASAADVNNRNSSWLEVIARVPDGAPLGPARAAVEAISQQAYRDSHDEKERAGYTITPLREYQVGNARPALLLLLGAVGFVLLIGCANVSNLVLMRVTSRQRELAVRAAIGASRWRLSAQLLTESLLLSLLGGAAGLLLVLWGTEALIKISPISVPRLAEARIDLPVFFFALGASIVCGALFGVLPALRGARHDVITALRQAGATAGAPHSRLRSTLLVSEVALTVVLLAGAALALTSFTRLLRVDRGFDADHVLIITMRHAGKWNGAQQRAFFEELEARTRTMPGVAAAGMVDYLPLGGGWSQYSTTAEQVAEDAQPEQRGKPISYEMRVVTPGYFHATRIRLRSGRLFTDTDAAGAEPVAIVTEEMARSLWGDASPLGRKVRVSGRDDVWSTVIGVVGGVRHRGLEVQPNPMTFRPLAQVEEAWGTTFVVRTAGPAANLGSQIRSVARSLDAAIIINKIQPFDALVSANVAMPRFLAVILSSFGGFALLLAAVGVYGVFAYTVRQRTQEIGVRMALGAAPREIFRWVVLHAARLTALGVAIGMIGAAALARVVAHLLFSVTAAEPGVYTAAPLLIGAVALLACWIPARRATRVEPVVALRYE
jgi:putative ABC transport system permease protein